MAVLYLHDSTTVVYPFALEPVATLLHHGAGAPFVYADIGLPPLGGPRDASGTLHSATRSSTTSKRYRPRRCFGTARASPSGIASVAVEDRHVDASVLVAARKVSAGVVWNRSESKMTARLLR